MQGVYAHIYRDSGSTEQEVRDFYDQWQAIRYGTRQVTPKDGLRYLRLAERIIKAIMGKLSTLSGEPLSDIEERVMEEVLGAKVSKIEDEVSILHDQLLWQAEAYAENTEGASKLAAKLLHTSNFCNVLVAAADPLTQDLVVNSDHIAGEIASFYSSFVRLVGSIQMARMSTGIDFDNALNFSLFVRLGYFGMSASEVFEDFRSRLREAGLDF